MQPKYRYDIVINEKHDSFGYLFITKYDSDFNKMARISVTNEKPFESINEALEFTKDLLNR